MELKIFTVEELLNDKPSTEENNRYKLAMVLTVEARDLARPVGAQARNRVKNRGQRLHAILWQGRQWAVTPHADHCNCAETVPYKVWCQ